MVVGYTLGRAFVYSTPEYSIIKLPFEIVQAAFGAVFAIIVSFIPKISAIIGTMPASIIGGVSFMLYGMISAIGVRNVVENRVDLTNSRNLIIMAVIFVCGLGFSNGITFQVGGASITLTALAIAAIAGILLNIILPGNDYEFGVNERGDEYRGLHQ